uniref:Uncharacterized protein n=1 Tax=Cannabis sativa TaxID=3483 RepID=A0A803QCM6_CANSA
MEMDSPQSSRPQGQLVEPCVDQTNPLTRPVASPNFGDNAGVGNSNLPTEWQQIFQEMCSIILCEEDELRRLRQPASSATVEKVLPPAPMPVVGNQGFMLPHRDSVFERFVKLEPRMFLGGTDII